MAKTKAKPKTISLEKAAKDKKCCVGTIYGWIRSKKVNAEKVRDKYRIICDKQWRAIEKRPNKRCNGIKKRPPRVELPPESVVDFSALLKPKGKPILPVFRDLDEPQVILIGPDKNKSRQVPNDPYWKDEIIRLRLTIQEMSQHCDRIMEESVLKDQKLQVMTETNQMVCRYMEQQTQRIRELEAKVAEMSQKEQEEQKAAVAMLEDKQRTKNNKNKKNKPKS